MADGYVAHLSQSLKDETCHHLPQCGCWICDYHRQQNRESPESYEVSDIGMFNANYPWMYRDHEEGIFK